MSQKLTDSARIGAGIAGVFGLAVAVFSVILAFEKFNWPITILNFLFFMCFVWIVLYLYTSKISSKTTFRAIIVTYCITLVLRDLIFHDDTLPVALSSLIGFLAVLEFAGLIILDTGWRYVSSVKSVLIFIMVSECVISSILTWNILTGSSLFDNPVYSVIGVWIRPVIAVCLSWCYFSRMKMKEKETKEK